MTFWVNTNFFYFVYIVIRYWRPNCTTIFFGDIHSAHRVNSLTYIHRIELAIFANVIVIIIMFKSALCSCFHHFIICRRYFYLGCLIFEHHLTQGCTKKSVVNSDVAPTIMCLVVTQLVDRNDQPLLEIGWDVSHLIPEKVFWLISSAPLSFGRRRPWLKYVLFSGRPKPFRISLRQ